MAERTGLDARTPETCICAEDKWAPLCPVHGAPGKAHFTSNTVGIEPPYDVALPKITPEIWEAYQDEEFIEDSPRWEWTQAAVDFACEIVRPAVRAEIERLKRGNEILRDELVKIDALHDSVESERDRLRAAVARALPLLELIAGTRGTECASPRYQADKALHILAEAVNGEPGSAVETNERLGWAEEERKCLLQYHDFHGRQMPDPQGAAHRYRAEQLRRIDARAQKAGENHGAG